MSYIHCPHCNSNLKTNSIQPGRIVSCPRCKKKFAMEATPPPVRSAQNDLFPPTGTTSPVPPPTPTISRNPSLSSQPDTLPILDSPVIPERIAGSERTIPDIHVQTTGPSESREPAQQNQAAGLVNRFIGSMKKTAALAAKYAQLKALTWDLNRADEATGIKGYASHIKAENFPDIYARINRIDEDVAAKRRAEPIPQNESMSDKAARIAHEAKKKVEVEALSSERKKRLRDLGERLRTGSESPDNHSLECELRNARSINSKVEATNAEIALLSRQSPRLVRNAVLCAAVAGVLLVGYWSLGFLFRSKPDYRAKSSSSVAAKTNATRESISRQIAGVSQRIETERVEREANRKLNAEQSALEFEQRKLESAKKARDEEKTRLDAQQKFRIEEAQQAAKAQENRQQLADALFGRIVLDPARNVVLSRTLKNTHKASVELRGPQYAEMAKLHENQKWVELINLVTKNSYTEFPVAYEIESGARNLLNFELTMLVKTRSTFEQRGDEAPLLHLVTFPVEIVRGVSNGRGLAIYPANIQAESSYWQRHPDGIGYLHKWHPGDRMSVVVLAPWSAVSMKVEQLNQQIRQRRSELDAKKSLGEINESSVEAEMAITADRIYNNALNWATGL